LAEGCGSILVQETVLTARKLSMRKTKGNGWRLKGDIMERHQHGGTPPRSQENDVNWGKADP